MTESPAAVIARAIAEGTRMSDDTLGSLRSIPVLDLVEGCQEALTSEDERSVSIAIYVLGRATQHRPSADPINKASLITLIQFLGMKARKYGTCDAAVEAAANLIGATAGGHDTAQLLQDDEVTTILVEQFLPYVHAQSLLLNTRRHFLSIFKTIVDHSDALRSIASSNAASHFLKSFLTSVDGERDPVLLLETFQMHRIILSVFSAESLSFLLEDMFESISRYFPVLFTPPSGCQVSRHALKSALGQALESARFHEMCPPFLCGKLSSPSANSKHDSLETLNAIFGIASQYTHNMLLPHVPEVLTTIRAETLKLSAYQDRSPEALDTLKKALQSLTTVARTVVHAVDDRSVALSLLEPIIGGAVSTMETDATSGRSYATLLHAVARADIRVATAMSSYLFPVISALVEDAPSPNLVLRRMENCFSCLGGLLSATEELCATAMDKAAVASMLSNERLFVRPQVLGHLYESLCHAAMSQSASYVLQVACESIATWVALAKHCEGVWASSITNAASIPSPWKILIDRVFGADVTGEAAQLIAASIGNTTRVDADGFVQVCRQLLKQWGTHERFLDSLRHIAEANRGNAVACALLNVLLEDHALVLLSNADETWGGGGQHEVDKSVFGLAAWLVTLCDHETVAGHCEGWIRLTLAASGGVHAFEFAALLFAGSSHDTQRTALENIVGSLDKTTGPASADAHSERYSMMVLCGSSPKAVSEAVPSEAGLTYAERLLETVMHNNSVEESKRLPLSISLRCLEAVVNKVALSAEQHESLWRVWERRHSRNGLLAASSLAKGLLSRGATAQGNQWSAAILTVITGGNCSNGNEEECNADDPAAAAAALGSIIAAPLPIVSSPLWNQRFFLRSVQALVAENSHAFSRMAALCALVVNGNSAHVEGALPTILTYVSKCIDAPPSSSQSSCEMWRYVAELLRSLYEADRKVGEALTTSLHPCVELVLLRTDVFKGLGEVLRGTNHCPMSSKRAALFLLKSLGLELERVKAFMAGDNEDTVEAQAGAMRSTTERVRTAPVEEVLGAARLCEKSITSITQAALSHPKRLVRVDAADCRRVWDRVRKC